MIDRPAEDEEPAEYLVARLSRALAEDPRTAELGVRVAVHGRSVHLCGEVATPERCVALSEVVTEQAPGHEIRNDVRVLPAAPPTSQEKLS